MNGMFQLCIFLHYMIAVVEKQYTTRNSGLWSHLPWFRVVARGEAECRKTSQKLTKRVWVRQKLVPSVSLAQSQLLLFIKHGNTTACRAVSCVVAFRQRGRLMLFVLFHFQNILSSTCLNIQPNRLDFTLLFSFLMAMCCCSLTAVVLYVDLLTLWVSIQTR